MVFPSLISNSSPHSKRYLRRTDSFKLEPDISKIYPLSSLFLVTSNKSELLSLYANIKRILLSSNFLFNYKKNQSQVNFIVHLISLFSMFTFFILAYSSSKITIPTWNWRFFKLFIPSLQIIPHWFFFYYSSQNKANTIITQMRHSSQIVLNNYTQYYSLKLKTNFDIELLKTNKKYNYNNNSQYLFISHIINIPTFEKKYYQKICSNVEMKMIEDFYKLKLTIKKKYSKVFICRYLVPICLYFVTLVYNNKEMNGFDIVLMFGFVLCSAFDLYKIKKKIKEEIWERIDKWNRVLVKKGYYIFVSDFMLSIIKLNYNIMKNSKLKYEEYKAIQKKIRKVFEE